LRSKLFVELCIGFLGVLATGIASADSVTEYTSLASWDSAVSDVTTYTILAPPMFGALFVFNGETGEMIGPGTFTTPGNLGLIFNDGLFGNVQYVAASPGAFEGSLPATVVTSFDASAHVTALAFTLGSETIGSDINVSVNGLALAPLVVSPASPTAFLGVADISGPITSVAFTVSNFQGSATEQEMDVIGSYATAVAKAPEIDPASATSGLTLLLGGLAVLRGRKRASPP
jgi:predicted membrane protein